MSVQYSLRRAAAPQKNWALSAAQRRLSKIERFSGLPALAVYAHPRSDAFKKVKLSLRHRAAVRLVLVSRKFEASPLSDLGLSAARTQCQIANGGDLYNFRLQACVSLCLCEIHISRTVKIMSFYIQKD